MKRAVALRRRDAPDAGRYHRKSERAVPMRERAIGSLEGLSRRGKGRSEEDWGLSRCGTGGLKIGRDSPEAGQARQKRKDAFPKREGLIRNGKMLSRRGRGSRGMEI